MLAGQVSYDDLDSNAQAAVRLAWDEQVAYDVARLDLTTRLRATGRPWAVADEDGNLIWHQRLPASPGS